MPLRIDTILVAPPDRHLLIRAALRDHGIGDFAVEGSRLNLSGVLPAASCVEPDLDMRVGGVSANQSARIRLHSTPVHACAPCQWSGRGPARVSAGLRTHRLPESTPATLKSRSRATRNWARPPPACSSLQTRKAIRTSTG